MIGVAKLIAEGKLTKERLEGAGEIKKVEKMLAAIRGIGPWTANYQFVIPDKNTSASDGSGIKNQSTGEYMGWCGPHRSETTNGDR
ncbi:hypothetical protein [uncultured Paenibacillus sp.]|uniref:hypothetical protein n=1 Tax=uncultured Paenibacillus sp. TaxID=227322 RepID=UPI0037DCE15B